MTDKPKFKFIGHDDWSRALYQSVKTGIVYVDVAGQLHDMTDEGEPISPLCPLSAVEIVGAP